MNLICNTEASMIQQISPSTDPEVLISVKSNENLLDGKTNYLPCRFLWVSTSIWLVSSLLSRNGFLRTWFSISFISFLWMLPNRRRKGTITSNILIQSFSDKCSEDDQYIHVSGYFTSAIVALKQFCTKCRMRRYKFNKQSRKTHT